MAKVYVSAILAALIAGLQAWVTLSEKLDKNP